MYDHEKGGMAARIAGIVAAALLFGSISGAAMVGVNLAAAHFMTPSEQTVPAREAVADTTAAPAPVFPQAAVPQEALQSAEGADVSAIVENAMPSVVAISTKIEYETSDWFFGRQTYQAQGSGSGIIVGKNDDELLIVTNNHVVADSKEMKVTFIDEQSVTAAIKGSDSDSDLAVIAVNAEDIPAKTLGSIRVAQIGDSDSLKVGKGVVAIGNALGYGQSVTVGYISALNREVRTPEGNIRVLLQTDAAINPGNSGGALLNMQGELIGINAAKYSSTEVEGVGYAIPISKAQDIINELMSKKTRREVAEGRRGYLGIQSVPIDGQTSKMFGMPVGIYVYKIVEGSAAANSSLNEKDIITKFDGQSVRTFEELKDLLRYYEAGTSVTLTVQSIQDGAYVERTVELTLGDAPEN